MWKDPVGADWLLEYGTPGGSSTLRVWTWRRLRSLGAHYVQQSVCLLPAPPATSRAVNRVIARRRDQHGHGQVLRIALTDADQEAAVIESFQRERTDEYGEVIERPRHFHDELADERRRGRATYTELEEPDADLARHQKWLAAIDARGYFDAPGAHEAAAAVAACEAALVRFGAQALATELDPQPGVPATPATPRLRSIECGPPNALHPPDSHTEGGEPWDSPTSSRI